MDIKDMIKLQMLGQMGMQQQNKTAQTPLMMFYQVLLMGLMNVVDDIIKAIPRFFEHVKMIFCAYFKSQVKQTIETRTKTLNDLSVLLGTKHFQNSIYMSRVFKSVEGAKTAPVNEESNRIIDSVLAQIAKLANVPTMQLIEHGQIMVTYKEKPIQMTKDIFFKVQNLHISDSGVVNAISFTLMSNTITATEISTYVNTLYSYYLEELKNALGNNIYFFEQVHKESRPPGLPPPGGESISNHKRMLICSAPKVLSYTMAPFYSNKKFSNVFGEQARLVEQRTKFFIENREWYDLKGIPYQLGVLLSGKAGTGKSSLIKAIANVTKRHIINVNFANITTATQLKNLFCSDKIQVYTDNNLSNSQTYCIPIEQRLYVLEEIDAIGDIVKQRKNENGAATVESIPDELNLMEILTVLDGTMEMPGRIVIMTTNHPEMLDKALIRPGRIDIHVDFDYAKKELIAEMYEGYMDNQFPMHEVHRLPDMLLTPAEVGQVLFRHFRSNNVIEDVIQDLIKTGDEILQKRPGYVKPHVVCFDETVDKTAADKVVDKTVDKTVDKVVDKTVDKVVDKTVDKVVEKVVEKVVDKVVEKVVDKTVSDISPVKSNIGMGEYPSEITSKLSDMTSDFRIHPSDIDLYHSVNQSFIPRDESSDNTKQSPQDIMMFAEDVLSAPDNSRFGIFVSG
jgi:AAA+ superfamily predicted ATPase